jgi:hypothetical protein
MGAGAAGAPDTWIWVRPGPLADQTLLEHLVGHFGAISGYFSE